jgi:O-antigen/teichoic acid export membrane protein
LGYLDWVQWPAMAVTVLAAWLIGSQRPRRRMIGFVCFSVSNVLWVIWGLHAQAYALIVLQLCLFLMNFRGLKKNLKGKQEENLSSDGGRRNSF